MNEPDPLLNEEQPWVGVCLLMKLGAVSLLVAACAAAPVAAATLVSPWVGVLLAAGGFWLWTHLGPRPCPGYLSGLLCIWGSVIILGTFAACLILALESLLA
jgi:hypothetical protein